MLRSADVRMPLVEAEDGAAAIAQLQQQTFDAILLDYHLPDGDGLSLVRQVRHLGFSLPMIVLTEQGDEEVAVEVMKAGASDYFAKGKLVPKTLCHSLINAVRIQRAEIQAAEANQRLRESDFNLIHADDRPQVLQAITAHLKQGTPFDVEFRIRHASGDYRYCTSRGKAQRNANGTLFRMSGIVSDITARKRTEEKLNSRVQQQVAIAQLGQQALQQTDLPSLMHAAVTLVAQNLRVPYVKVTELLPDQETLLLKAGVGWKPGLVGQATLPADRRSQAGYTLLCGKPVICDDLNQEDRFHQFSLHREHGLVSGISVIIQTQEETFGVFSAYSNTFRLFTREDVNFLQAIANILASAIDQQRSEAALRQSEQNLRQTLNLLAQHQRQLRTLQQLTDLLNRRLTNLPELLQVMVTAMCTAIPNAEFGLIVLQNSTTKLLELTAVTGTGTHHLQLSEPFAPGEGLLGEIFLTGNSRLIQVNQRDGEMGRRGDGEKKLEESSKFNPSLFPLSRRSGLLRSSRHRWAGWVCWRSGTGRIQMGLIRTTCDYWRRLGNRRRSPSPTPS